MKNLGTLEFMFMDTDNCCCVFRRKKDFGNKGKHKYFYYSYLMDSGLHTATPPPYYEADTPIRKDVDFDFNITMQIVKNDGLVITDNINKLSEIPTITNRWRGNLLPKG